MLGEAPITTILLAVGLAGLFVLLFQIVKDNIYLRSFLEVIGLGIVLSVWITALANYFFNRTFNIDLSFLGIPPYSSISFSVSAAGIVVSICLLILCYARAPLVFLEADSLTATRMFELFWPFIFCLSYATTYTYFFITQQQGFVVETILSVSVTGLIGVSIPNKRFTAALLLPQMQQIDQQIGETIRLGFRWMKKEWKVLTYSTLCLTSLALAFFPYSISENVNYQVLYTDDKGAVVSKPVSSIDNYSNLSGYYQEKGDTLKALAYSDKFLRIFPEDAPERLKRANLFISLGEDEQAIEEFKKAVSLNPSLTDAYFGLILLYEKTGFYADAIKSTEEVIPLLSGEQKQQLLMVQASLLLKTGEYELASKALDQVTPELEETSLMKGIASLGQGDIEKAKAVFNQNRQRQKERVLSGGFNMYIGKNVNPWMLSPSYSDKDFFFNLKGYFLSKKYLTPILETIVSKNPESGGIAYKPLSVLYYDQGLKSGALNYLDRAISAAKSDKKQQESLISDAIQIAKELNDDILLENYYESYLKTAQNSPQDTDDIAQVYYTLGNLRVSEGKIQEAIDDYSQAIKYKHDYKEAYFARAQAYAKLDRFDQALLDMKIASQVDPGWIDAQIFSGYYSSKQQKFNEAATIFASIENQAQNNVLYFRYLGYLRIMQGDRNVALSAYERCFHLLQTNYYSDLTDKYQEISDELNDLLDKEPDKKQIINDIFLLMRGSMSSKAKTTTSNSSLNSTSSSIAASPTALPSTQSATPPTKKTLWLQISTVGPEKIDPGSSDIVEIVAKLTNSPDSSGTALPLEMLDTHQYVIHINLQAVNFEVNDPQKSYDLTLGEPVQWQYIISPKADHEGGQKIAYEIVVEDNDPSASDYPKSISVGTIVINVPTKYGIPPNLLYPLSGLLAGIAAISALPIWNYLKSYLDEKGDKKKTKK